MTLLVEKLVSLFALIAFLQIEAEQLCAKLVGGGGFVVPYCKDGVRRRYLPDFIATAPVAARA